ncbi:MAG: bile acid:sodium symporter [Tomitella sp.]|nr:bile acid:sodium symporter [Tomitella sp.]
MSAVADGLERHQVALYAAAIAAGVAFGAGAPGLAERLAVAIMPALAVLLFVTFLQVPARGLVTALRDGRFIAAVLVINFVVVPLMVAALFPLLPTDQAVRVGALLVLLCPCVDYVIVFCGLAGGDNRRLLATTPLLLVLQFLALPLLLILFLGADFGGIVDAQPFVEAFVAVIALPLALAWGVQWWASRHETGRRLASGSASTMVPLMMLVLVLVVSSQWPRIDDNLGAVAGVAPLYAVFLVAMALAGAVVARIFRLKAPAGRAVLFSGATRNSLVVLPLALALPAGFEIAAAVVVTQTFVELLSMVAYVRVVPILLPYRDRRAQVPSARPGARRGGRT